MASLEDGCEEGETPEEEGNDEMISIFDEFRREVSMFSTLQHSRIVDLKGLGNDWKGGREGRRGERGG